MLGPIFAGPRGGRDRGETFRRGCAASSSWRSATSWATWCSPPATSRRCRWGYAHPLRRHVRRLFGAEGTSTRPTCSRWRVGATAAGWRGLEGAAGAPVISRGDHRQAAERGASPRPDRSGHAPPPTKCWTDVLRGLVEEERSDRGDRGPAATRRRRQHASGACSTLRSISGARAPPGIKLTLRSFGKDPPLPPSPTATAGPTEPWDAHAAQHADPPSRGRWSPYAPATSACMSAGRRSYDLAHIGNARPIVVFDVLYRLLRRLYPSRHLRPETSPTSTTRSTRPRARPASPSNRSPRAPPGHSTRDIAALGALPPRRGSPRATAHIAEMIALIETLIAAGNAYEGRTAHVALSRPPRPPATARFPAATRDEMIAGAPRRRRPL